MHVRAFVAAQPLDAVRVWRRGTNGTDYGVHVFSERSARLIAAAYAERGNLIALDVEHLGAEPPTGTPPPTAGYASLEFRSDGSLWIRPEWSAYAEEQIRTRQRMALSPEYDVSASGEIVRLVRVSLVAEPGTWGAMRVAATASAPIKLTSFQAECARGALRMLADNRPAVARVLLRAAAGRDPTTPKEETAMPDMIDPKTALTALQDVRQALGDPDPAKAVAKANAILDKALGASASEDKPAAPPPEPKDGDKIAARAMRERMLGERPAAPVERVGRGAVHYSPEHIAARRTSR